MSSQSECQTPTTTEVYEEQQITNNNVATNKKVQKTKPGLFDFETDVVWSIALILFMLHTVGIYNLVTFNYLQNPWTTLWSKYLCFTILDLYNLITYESRKAIFTRAQEFWKQLFSPLDLCFFRIVSVTIEVIELNIFPASSRINVGTDQTRSHKTKSFIRRFYAISNKRLIKLTFLFWKEGKVRPCYTNYHRSIYSTITNV